MPQFATGDDRRLERINWIRSLPFLLIHLMLLLPLFTGVSVWMVLLCLASYYVRMFAVTAGYHRYFSHRSFKTGRIFQLVLAFLAQTSGQKGVLWWAALHRHHHLFSDTEEDIHSPARRGFWWAHVGWIVSSKYEQTRLDKIKDFARDPELRFLDRFHLLPLFAWAAAMWALFGIEGLVWGFGVSTVLLYHGTFAINSLAHVFGRRRYATGDDSRNSLLLALITMGEGWHNNHHRYQSSANQGFFWWEIDPTWYVLKVLSWVGLVRDLRAPPRRVFDEARRPRPEGREAPPLPALR
jgi:stearoyl-CoA desaturase (delta-9 desaturase)